MLQNKSEMNLIQGKSGPMWGWGNACVPTFVHQTRYVHRFITIEYRNSIKKNQHFKYRITAISLLAVIAISIKTFNINVSRIKPLVWRFDHHPSGYSEKKNSKLFIQVATYIFTYTIAQQLRTIKTWNKFYSQFSPIFKRVLFCFKVPCLPQLVLPEEYY